MTRLVGLALAVLAIPAALPAAPPPPAAPGPGPDPADAMWIYLSGGISVPEDPPELREFWGTGPSVGGGIGIRFSEYWELVATCHWQRFPADEAAQAGDLLLQGPGGTLGVQAIAGRDATALTVTAELRFHFPTERRRMLPYLSFGWGYFDISTSDATVTSTDPGLQPVVVLGDTDGAFAATIGGGLQFPMSPATRLVLESAYTVGFTEPVSSQYLPLRLGVGFRI